MFHNLVKDNERNAFFMKLKSKQAELSLIIGMAIAVFCAGFCNFAREYDGITETVFRLHILANSDSPEDQSLKLKVRDAVLAETSDIFQGNRSASEAAAAAESSLGDIQKIAERTIRENGYDYSVNCEVTEMLFDSRIYDSLTMPAGNYSALRITIGEAEGKNWWCVMFPPLCLPAVTNIDEALEEYEGVFTEEELDMLRNPENYECRFYFLELLHKAEEYFSSRKS